MTLIFLQKVVARSQTQQVTGEISMSSNMLQMHDNGVMHQLCLDSLLVFVFWSIFYICCLQITNVYNQEYESAGAFWPHVHGRIIASLLISQLLLLGLLSTKKAANSTPLLIILPVLTIWFHKYCKSRFEPAFRKYPLEVSSILCSKFLDTYLQFILINSPISFNWSFTYVAVYVSRTISLSQNGSSTTFGFNIFKIHYIDFFPFLRRQ